MNPRIVGACVGGLALVVIAFYFSHAGKGAAIPPDGSLAVVAGHAPKRTYIATGDSNNDGIPDWQEALGTTEPLMIDKATSTYEVPDTITDQFAVNFFQSYMQAKGAGPFGSSDATVVNNAVRQLETETQDELYGPDDIVSVTAANQASLQNYGNAVLHIAGSGVVKNTANEAQITLEAVQTQNADKLKALDEKISAYENYISSMMALPVPEGFTKAHLNLINSYNAVLNDIQAMRSAFDDPLYTLVRLQRYQEDTKALSISLEQLFGKLKDAGITSFTVY